MDLGPASRRSGGGDLLDVRAPVGREDPGAFESRQQPHQLQTDARGSPGHDDRLARQVEPHAALRGSTRAGWKVMRNGSTLTAANGASPSSLGNSVPSPTSVSSRARRAQPLAVNRV